MDISTSARPVSPPPAGSLRLIYEDGHVRVYSNGTVLFRYFAVKDVALTTEDGWVVIQTNL
jgi:hypothetical protein